MLFSDIEPTITSIFCTQLIYIVLGLIATPIIGKFVRKLKIWHCNKKSENNVCKSKNNSASF